MLCDFFISIALVILTLQALRSPTPDGTLGNGPQIQVALISDQSEVAPGIPFHFGVHFIPEPGWHIYWSNTGNSGLAPKFSWAFEISF